MVASFVTRGMYRRFILVILIRRRNFAELSFWKRCKISLISMAKTVYYLLAGPENSPDSSTGFEWNLAAPIKTLCYHSRCMSAWCFLILFYLLLNISCSPFHARARSKYEWPGELTPIPFDCTIRYLSSPVAIPTHADPPQVHPHAPRPAVSTARGSKPARKGGQSGLRKSRSRSWLSCSTLDSFEGLNK